jgi:hypothetical protein
MPERAAYPKTDQTRFKLYFYGALAILCIGTGVYFAFHLSRNLMSVLQCALLSVATVSAFAGTYRAWRKSLAMDFK